MPSHLQAAILAFHGFDVATDAKPECDIDRLEFVESETTEKAPSGKQTYQIKSGDTLSGIASRFYGRTKSHKWTVISQANPQMDPNNLEVGATITIPAQ